AGIVLRPNASLPDLAERLETMAQAMAHRGPDDQGISVAPGDRAGLVNRRLAIRDLSPAGHMPMGSGSLCITYNGEIYNAQELRSELEGIGYQFCSNSDTEAILHGYAAWGAGVVHKLRGMFAFAILDRRADNPEGRLFVARDRLGIKPLYYAETSQAFVFASELKALISSGLVGREINPAGLAGYLMLGSVPNPLTIYRDARALEPGCTLTIEAGSAPTIRRYWSLPKGETEQISTGEAVERVRALLEEAVRIRLVSDVPLGAFLSGGLDSSAVVALMRKATDGPIRTCSMVFEEAGYSEAPYARAMAQAAGAEHYERVVTAEDVAGEMDRIMWAMDQPTIDGVNTYFVSQTAREAGLTVALSGLGGDELFGGYANTFRGVPQMLKALRLTRAVPGGGVLAQSAIGLLPDRERWGRVGDALLRPPSLASAYMTRRGLFSPGEVKALLAPDVWREAARAFDTTRHIGQRAGSTRQAGAGDEVFAWVSRAELSTYTHHQLLRDTDVMSMAHSLEVRVPLLDHVLVETVLRMPTSVKVNGVGPKSLLLKAMGDDLPEAVKARRAKQGFTFPFDKWLRGPLRGYVNEGGERDNNPMLRAEAVKGVQRAFRQGKVHWSRAWALAVLRAWGQWPETG
ncbi:MAG TPA: asparagine synthase (glutamine-hydrolyzing), partial [Chloroflexia bacterium]|nr:asparagine synthase (glutamine-hydrolyzing) [Chloroflexia bacterium]